MIATGVSRLPWVDRGCHFLSPYPESMRRRMVLMPVQVFVDESIGYGSPRHFGMAGLLSTAEKWIAFSDEWQATLNAAPSIRWFKMSEAARCSGEFGKFGKNGGRWGEDERNAKLASLAAVINRHVESAIYSLIDLDAHQVAWANAPKPMNEPYFWPYQTMVMSACFDLWHAGSRDAFQIIFDEQKISGIRVKRWYPVLQELMRQTAGDAASILPPDTQWGTDEQFMPLQAADMIVGCVRRGVDDGGPFAWLDDHMPNLKWSERSMYHSRETMGENGRSARAGVDWSDPDQIARVYRSVFEN